MPVSNPIEQRTRDIFDTVLPGLVPGYASNPDQQEYARRVAASFGAPDPVRPEGGEITFLEAATGTGKTLGYLLPLLLNSVLTNERSLVSTHTIALQTQIVESDGPLACDAVERLTGLRPSIARRIGKRNFVDYERVAGLMAVALSEGRTDIVEILQAWIDARPDTFDLGVQEHGLSLLAGVSQDELSINAASPLDASDAYLRHVEASHAADVVVVNHALSLIDAKAWGHAIVDHQSGRRRLAIFDEADTLPQAARDMADQRFPISSIKLLANAMPRGAARAKLKEVTEALRRRMLEMSSGAPVIIDEGRHGEALAGVEALVAAIRDARTEVADADEDLADELRRLRADLDEWLAAARGDRYTVAVVSATPIKSRPAMVLVSTDPARILSRLWSRPRSGDDPFLRSVVFTSATLSNDGASNWSGFMRAMGINPAWSNYASARSASFEPRKFGSAEFMLADRSVPAPFKKDSRDHDPAWLDYVVHGIEVARQKGGRVLVLANSYAEAEALGQRLDDVLSHRRGEPLGHLIASYKAQPDAVLITPAAWAGVNLPGLVQQLVIPRVPFAPRDEARDLVRTKAMIARGVDPATAEGILRAEATANARRKLRQGMGRGIRAATDSCTIWVLDPRFPLPPRLVLKRRLRLTQGLASKHGALVKVIPARFRTGVNSAFDRASIFPANKAPNDAAAQDGGSGPASRLGR